MHERVNLDTYLRQLVNRPHSIICSTPLSHNSCLKPFTQTQVQTALRLKGLLVFWGYQVLVQDVHQVHKRGGMRGENSLALLVGVEKVKC